MTATIIEIAFQRIQCSACGAEANASCNCGAPYLTAAARVAKALAATPEKSDRVIAAELGVGNATVSRIRRKSPVSDDTPESVTGRDGKKYPLKRRGERSAAKPEREAPSVIDLAPGDYHFQHEDEDIVTHALRLVGRMNADQRERFLAQLEVTYGAVAVS
jgi:hypothetical protein